MTLRARLQRPPLRADAGMILGVLGQRVVVENNDVTRAAPGEGLTLEWSRDGRGVAFLRFLGPIGREIVSRAGDRSGTDQVLFRDSSALLFDFRLGSAGGWSILRSGSTGGPKAVVNWQQLPALQRTASEPRYARTTDGSRVSRPTVSGR